MPLQSQCLVVEVGTVFSVLLDTSASMIMAMVKKIQCFRSALFASQLQQVHTVGQSMVAKLQLLAND